MQLPLNYIVSFFNEPRKLSYFEFKVKGHTLLFGLVFEKKL